MAALILARGGSKGIPLKNLAKVGGRSLLRRSLEAIFKTRRFSTDLQCHRSEGFSSVWVSTNHKLIADEAIRFNANVHWRSEESATDTATSISAVREFLSVHREIDLVALIQCTSPFLKAGYLEEAIGLLRSGRVDCVFSVTRYFLNGIILILLFISIYSFILSVFLYTL